MLDEPEATMLAPLIDTFPPDTVIGELNVAPLAAMFTDLVTVRGSVTSSVLEKLTVPPSPTASIASATVS